MWIILVIQTCKLQTLVGVSSMGIAASTAIIVSYTLPFVYHLVINDDEKDKKETRVKGADITEPEGDHRNDSDELLLEQQKRKEERERAQNIENASQTSIQFKASTIQLFLYVIYAANSTYYAYLLLSHDLLVSLLLRDPTMAQMVAACFAVWFTFIALLLLAFRRTAAAPRRSSSSSSYF